jgi:hypothetical protein
MGQWHGDETNEIGLARGTPVVLQCLSTPSPVWKCFSLCGLDFRQSQSDRKVQTFRDVKKAILLCGPFAE